MKELNAAQRLWESLGLPTAMARHKNGGPRNQGCGPTHNGWALHKLRERQAKFGYRRRLGIGKNERPANGSRP